MKTPKIRELERKLADALARYGPDHPEVKKAQEELDAEKARIPFPDRWDDPPKAP